MLTLIRKFSVDLWILLAVVLYFVAARAGLLLTFEISGDSVLWPPPGLALALLLLLGKKIWPGIALGSLLASLLWFLHIDVVLSVDIIYSSTLMAVGQTFEALLGFFLINRFIKELDGFSKSTHVFRFLYIALGITVVGAAFSTGSMLIVYLLDSNSLLSFFMFKWLSNVVSILIITPFILSWKWKIKISISKRLVMEVIIMGLFVTLLVYLFGIESINSSITQAIPFLIIPLFIWIIFRFNIQTVMTAMIVTAFTAIYITTSGLGPFYLEDESNSLLLVQIFIGMASITSLVLYSTVKERRDSQIALENFNEKLETKVEERTKKLEEEIEERKKMEEKTKVSNRRLRKTNEELDHFVYSVSHDLRAPIASILGLLNLAKMEDDKKTIKEILSKVEDSAKKQDSFIKDILDFSRNSRVAVKKDKVFFKEIIDDAFEHLKYGYGNKKVKTNLNINQESAFVSDLGRLKVIFYNIIANALRYTNGNKPTINIEVNSNGKNAAIIIKDNGIGIKKEHLADVFKMFYRATEEGSGSGLGLYIVKETLEKLNGKIELESKPGSGTTVKMNIPRVS